MIVGGGLTGLWTAYYLAPTHDVVVVEAEHVGFGASGRNGGWCSALFPASLDALARLPGSDRERAVAQDAAMRATIGEVERVCASEAIDCQFVRGGTVVPARNPAQLRRAEAAVAHARSFGLTDPVLLTADETRARLRAEGVLGGTYTADCARLHPLRLVHGLASAVVRRGGRIVEGVRATRVGPGRVATTHGEIRARCVVRATEGYTPALPGRRRAVAPVYSLIVATEPLAEERWAEIGLEARETFSDQRHLIIYGQRTADDRLVFGGRGAPYHLGSRVRPDFDRDERVFARLRDTLTDLLPAVQGARFTHAWGGPLGIARDWCASVGLDGDGMGWAGGYVGDGVSTTNLAGRTLRDLIAGEQSDLTALPWVGHRSPAWEPEPLRWLGINAGLRAVILADWEERRTGRPSRVAAAAGRLLGQ